MLHWSATGLQSCQGLGDIEIILRASPPAAGPLLWLAGLLACWLAGWLWGIQEAHGDTLNREIEGRLQWNARFWGAGGAEGMTKGGGYTGLRERPKVAVKGGTGGPIRRFLRERPKVVVKGGTGAL